MVGHVALTHGIGVRIPASQPNTEAFVLGSFLIWNLKKQIKSAESIDRPNRSGI